MSRLTYRLANKVLRRAHEVRMRYLQFFYQFFEFVVKLCLACPHGRYMSFICFGQILPNRVLRMELLAVRVHFLSVFCKKDILS